jgi:hypothetical protein
MSQFNVYYLSLKPETPCNSYWDYTFLNDFINGKLWKPTNWQEFKTHEVNNLPKEDKAIVVIPARHHAGLEMEIYGQVKKINRLVLFIMGDEEADFNIDLIKHSNALIFVQNPHPNRHEQYEKLGTGYAPIPKLKYKEKNKDIFFSGQLTHKRRMEMWEQLQQYEIHNGKQDINGTKGFTQGLEPEVYFDRLRQAKYAPAPSGAVIPDSFRLHEALEMMTIPIADDRNSQGTIDNYWEFLYPDAPLIRIKEWTSLSGYINDIDYDEKLFELMTWWFNYKRRFAYKVMDFLSV